MMFVLRKENDQVSIQEDREIKQYTGERRMTLELPREYCVSVCVDFKGGLDKRLHW